ncbi:MAG: choice-of-anchor D domain-containing protein [Gammaproteobacteria bacterium]|nr:choice-of-anchor D domain-containing protein [Gammaproteobacteria bacterium]
MNYLRIISGLSLLFITGVTHALTIVHMETQLASTTSDIYFELYDDVAPNNVSNFTGYISRGDYDNSFFHRKAQFSDGSPFVVQGGGFTYIPQFDFDARAFAVFGATTLTPIFDPITGELGLRPIGETYVVDANNDDIPDVDNLGNDIVRINEGLKRVPVDTSVQPVLSESSLSNLRGTIAMALTSSSGVTNTDSASNQWFINLNNNTQLDPNINNAGFTVFGKVIGNGIDFFDAVNNMNVLPIASTVNPEFGDLPVINLVPFTLVLGENLAKLNSASEVFNIDVTDYDFGFVDIGMTAQKVITLTVSPQWQSALAIKVGDIELLDSPLSVSTTNCNAAPIAPGNSCTITVTFAPVTADNFQDVLDIAFSSINIPNLPINFTARSRTLPKVFSSTANNLDFQYAFPDIPVTKTVSITNLGQQPLTFTTIAIDDVSNFTQTDNCIGVALAFNESCEIDVTFITPVEGLKTANLAIASNAPESPFVISLLGTGSITIVPDIDAETTHDFGDLLNGQTVSAQMTLTNRGVSELNLLSTSLTGVDASDFNGSSNCAAVLAPGESCLLTVVFSPSTTGAKNATLKIASNDPDEAEFSISLIGTSSSDSDNIPDAEESAAPNNGDGDSDSVPDRFQSNVVSMRTASGDYQTLTATSLLSFQNTAIIDNPSPADAPGGATFKHGILSFNFNPVPGTFLSKIGMILPAGQGIENFYQYGPTPDNPVPHWYQFMFDQNTGTGAQIFNNVTMTAPNGRAVQRDILQIWYVDGQRGDADLTVNGNITSTGGVSTDQSSGGGSSSSFSGYLALIMITLLLTLRYCSHYYGCKKYK